MRPLSQSLEIEIFEIKEPNPLVITASRHYYSFSSFTKTRSDQECLKCPLTKTLRLIRTLSARQAYDIAAVSFISPFSVGDADMVNKVRQKVHEFVCITKYTTLANL